MGVSVIMIAANEADRIGSCLESIAWADEIVVVVDAASTDHTAEICRQAGARVIIQPWLGFGRQRQVSLDAATQEWVLVIDADERVTPELRNTIRTLLALTPEFAAYKVPRALVFWGRKLRCRYPDYNIRFYRRDAGFYASLLVHESWDPHDRRLPIGVLQGDILHESERNVTSLVSKLSQYAELGAFEVLKRKRVTSLLPALVESSLNFIKYQLLRGGFLDGVPGLVYNLAHSYYFFHKYARAYEIYREQLQEKPVARLPEPTIESRQPVAK